VTNTLLRTIPQFGAVTIADRRTRIAGCAAAALLFGATWLGYAHGAQAGPKVTPFLAICATVWAFAELLTAFLLLSQFYVAGNLSLAFVAAGYLLSGLLTIPYLIFFPGVFTQGPLGHGDLQISAWLWLTWHLAFPTAVAIAHVIDGSLDTEGLQRSRIPGVLVSLLVGTAGLAAALFATIFLSREWLPIIVLAGGRFSPSFGNVVAPSIVALNAIVIAIVLLRARRLSRLQTWLSIALLTMALDGLLNVFSPGRYSVAWYVGKFEALVMATVVLAMLLLEVATLYRRLYAAATIDVLTGLPNRRSFMDVATGALAKRDGRFSGVAMLVIDVDLFKAYNDRYGHAAGDDALAAVGSALRTSVVRAGDRVARYGGEEFVVLLPNVLVAAAQTVAERVRRRVLGLDIVHEGAPSGRLTVSVGIGYCAGPVDISEPILFDTADRALYEAKAKGRDCVVLKQVPDRTLVDRAVPA
jgi:diguanylate cyclase (GGDEF)-like protein